jgi:hypothetical protein
MPRDIETVPDLVGFAAANGQQTEDEIRAALGDKFPKHIYHSIICIGALIAPVQPFEALRFAIVPFVEVKENHVRSDAISPPRSVFHEVLITRLGRG